MQVHEKEPLGPLMENLFTYLCMLGTHGAPTENPHSHICTDKNLCREPLRP